MQSEALGYGLRSNDDFFANRLIYIELQKTASLIT